MKIPSSEHFNPVSLRNTFNIDRQHLNEKLRLQSTDAELYGMQAIHGIPFELGAEGQANVIHLNQEAIHIEAGGIKATYILFLHAVVDRDDPLPEDLIDAPDVYSLTGSESGGLVSEYRLEYEDGSSADIPILRRFAIQQTHIGWGSSPYLAMPAKSPSVFLSSTDAFFAGEKGEIVYGWGETRQRSGRDSGREHLWVYALPNPDPTKPIQRIVFTPKEEQSVIYAITTTQVTEHPLRSGTRQKLKLTLPDSVALNALGELEHVDIDLGIVISARAALDYDRQRWLGTEPNVQPAKSAQAVIIEYIAHPMAKLYVGTGDDSEKLHVYDLAQMEDRTVVQVNPALRPVRLRIIEKASGRPIAVRLHLHGAAGEYLPPKGQHRRVNSYWFEDNYGEFVNSLNQYCYIAGECVVDLPLGEVFIEITRGYEVQPLRSSFTVSAATDELTFEMEKVLDWREKGWVTADTHVHFLSPQTALLEGTAEGVNVVNLLASQWGEMFSNVTDFDGRTTIGATEFGGDGEFLVRVGTENRMQVLGHISLLGYSGKMIHPLCSGGPSESAIGDALEVTMADWAQRCIDQNGLVILPHAPNPQSERAADIVLGLVHGIEMMTFNPFDNQINPYGVADWYRYLNLGYHLPVVGGSDKMAASSLLGGVRTYAHLREREFTYDNWMEAVQDGNTFVTVGPLAELVVEGHVPGQRVELPAGGGTVNVSWRVESVSLPIERVEIVVGGLAVEQTTVDGQLSAAGSAELKITDSTWIALRVRGSYRSKHGEIAAHTSAVQVIVNGQIPFSQPDALAVLEQIEGTIAYVDTLAPRPDAVRYKKLRASLEAAHNRLHQRLHQQGIYHRHTPVHHHDEHEED